MGKAQKKTGKGRLDKYYKLAKFVTASLAALASYFCEQGTRIPSPFSVQVDPVEQKIFFS
jgi:predicted transcriptional regulator